MLESEFNCWELSVLFIFFFVAMLIGGLIGYGAERLDIVDRSFVAAIIVGALGGLCGFMIITISGIGISYRVIAAIFGAIFALWIIPGRGK